MNAVSQPAALPDAPARERPKLVGVLSADEQRMLLAAALPQLEALPVDFAFLDPADGASADRLAALQPTILLTGWSSVRLSADLADPERGPLRYVCHLTGSVRHVVPRTFLEKGGLVTNWGDVASGAVAEHALLLALAALRNLAAWPDAIRRERSCNSHVEWLRPRSLSGRPVGVHGFGRVARALLPLLRPFGVTVSVYAPGVPASLIAAEGACVCGSIDELCAHSEVLFECEALTAGTARSVSAAALAALPDGAVFVNVARGGLVDEPALIAAAASGRIRVALDVVETEPLTANSPLLKLPGAVLSPHIAGPTFDLYPRIGRHAASNLRRFLTGAAPDSVVTLADFDRMT